MAAKEDTIFRTDPSEVAFVRLANKLNNLNLSISEQVKNSVLGWELPDTPEVHRLLQTYRSNPIVPLQDFIAIEKELYKKINTWRSLSRKTLSPGVGR